MWDGEPGEQVSVCFTPGYSLWFLSLNKHTVSVLSLAVVPVFNNTNPLGGDNRRDTVAHLRCFDSSRAYWAI